MCTVVTQLREEASRQADLVSARGFFLAYFAIDAMGQVTQIVCAACAVVAFGTIVNVQAAAAAQGSSASREIAERFSNARSPDYDTALRAFIAQSLSDLRYDAEILPLAPRDAAAAVHAGSALWEVVLTLGKWLLLVYAGYVVALALFQKRFVFNPTQADGPAAEPADTHEIARVRLALTHNKAIKGWLLRPRQGIAPYPAIIYYGGRSEEVSWLQGAVKWFPNHALLALNYRGYGESEGAPSEEGLFKDGLAQFDWLAAQPEVDPKAIVLVGRSLGTGVASYVAANRPAERVVLITPYDSLLAVASRRFWFAPLALLLRHKFKSVDYAKTNTQPCLALLAEHDDVIPEEHTYRLMAAWAGAKKLVRIPSTTHLNIPYQAATLAAVALWLGYTSVP